MTLITKKLSPPLFKASLLSCLAILGVSSLSSAAALKIGDWYGGGKVAYIAPSDDPVCRSAQSQDVFTVKPENAITGNADAGAYPAPADRQDKILNSKSLMTSSSEI